MSDGGDKYPDQWRVALFIDDRDALRLLAAYYVLPSRHRRDLSKLRELSGIQTGIDPLLRRLDAAGMLAVKADKPPRIVEMLLNNYITPRLRGGGG